MNTIFPSITATDKRVTVTRANISEFRNALKGRAFTIKAMRDVYLDRCLRNAITEAGGTFLYTDVWAPDDIEPLDVVLIANFHHPLPQGVAEDPYNELRLEHLNLFVGKCAG